MARIGPKAWLAWLEPFLAALPRAEQRRWSECRLPTEAANDG